VILTRTFDAFTGAVIVTDSNIVGGLPFNHERGRSQCRLSIYMSTELSMALKGAAWPSDLMSLFGAHDRNKCPLLGIWGSFPSLASWPEFGLVLALHSCNSECCWFFTASQLSFMGRCNPCRCVASFASFVSIGSVLMGMPIPALSTCGLRSLRAVFDAVVTVFFFIAWSRSVHRSVSSFFIGTQPIYFVKPFGMAEGFILRVDRSFDHFFFK